MTVTFSAFKSACYSSLPECHATIQEAHDAAADQARKNGFAGVLCEDAFAVSRSQAEKPPVPWDLPSYASALDLGPDVCTASILDLNNAISWFASQLRGKVVYRELRVPGVQASAPRTCSFYAVAGRDGHSPPDLQSSATT